MVTVKKSNRQREREHVSGLFGGSRSLELNGRPGNGRRCVSFEISIIELIHHGSRSLTVACAIVSF